MKPIPWTASGERTSSPNRTPAPREGEQAEGHQAQRARGRAASGEVGAPAEGRPKTTMITSPSTCSQNWPDHLAGDDRQAADRHRAEAVDDALGHVGRGGGAGADDPEGQRLADDSREQVVLVADPVDVDRRAEHVEEQQDEDDRLDRHVEQPLGHAGDRAQAAPGEQRVSRRSAGRARTSASGARA